MKINRKQQIFSLIVLLAVLVFQLAMPAMAKAAPVPNWPSITELSVVRGPTSGGTAVTITGLDFVNSSLAVTFGGSAATCSYVSVTEIDCTTPAHAAGDVDVVVGMSTGSVTIVNGFEYYVEPDVTGFTPTSDYTSGGAEVIITGTDFISAGLSVTFGGTTASCSYISSTEISCTAPAHSAGSVSISVSTDNGFSSMPGFTYIADPIPTITGISPSSGRDIGGTTVVITGTNFFSTGLSVTFGGLTTSCTHDSDSQLTCTTPAHPAGSVDVVIENTYGSETDYSGFTYIHDPEPWVSSIELIDPNPSLAGSLRYKVTFSEDVTGVDLADFKLVAVGVTGAAITKVEALKTAPTGNDVYRVTVSTGTKGGTLRLDVRNNGTIKDSVGGVLEGPFNSGPHYTLDRYSWLTSAAFRDGWILETTEFSSKGGAFNSHTSPYLLVGDDQYNRQYRSVVSFATQTLPANAIIQSVTLKIKLVDFQGSNPILDHGALVADVTKGSIGPSMYLEAGDFQAQATKGAVAVFLKDPLNPGWYSMTLRKADFGLINLLGTTEFRLRFRTDDDNDFVRDVARFESGNNSSDVLRPSLFVRYLLP
jgi:hypothetical protein